ncbi:hypothetical protein [Arsenicicoccus dermatophilus]|uniref:hypothetical protein n=1 Tax=Arsenicicoccus dermatophilus TaxID=1076331 RepID=UPI001F4C8F60|nr:hypothetical protein [Arsenicicoccus dermatophilus]MCH8613293.1 hypothetical protein [Arsenicicoccus dermatophilus]
MDGKQADISTVDFSHTHEFQVPIKDAHAVTIRLFLDDKVQGCTSRADAVLVDVTVRPEPAAPPSTAALPTARPRVSETGSSPSTPPTTSTAVAAAVCGQDGQPVSCESAHAREDLPATAVTSCDRSGILTYAGGDPSLDSLAPELHTRGAEDGCAVAWVTPLTGPLAGALGRSEGVSLRTCLTDRSGTRFVPCTQRHDLELVSGVHEARPSDAECLDLAERCLAAPAQSWQGSVTTTMLREGSTYRCAVGPTGDNQLVGSLRRNGTNAIRLQ